MSSSPIQRAFKVWRIWLAVIAGLTFSAWMLYQNLSEAHYVETVPHTGTHAWFDVNKNGIKESSEFYPGGTQNFEKETFSTLIKSLDWGFQSIVFLLFAILFMFGRDLAYMWRIRVLTENKLTRKAAFHTIMLWEFASALSPGIVGGSAVAMFILQREKIALGKASSIVIVTALMDNLFYICLIPLVFIFVGTTQLFPAISGVETLFWIGYGVIGLVCVLLFSSIFLFPKLISSLLHFVFRFPFLHKWKQKALRTGFEIEQTSAEFKDQKPRFWFQVALSTFLSWTSRYLVINCILAAFIHLHFSDHLFLFAKQLVLWLFMLISPTPGASGLAEYAFGELMVDFSNNGLLIIALAILWRLISYFPYLIIGSLILPKWLRKKQND